MMKKERSFSLFSHVFSEKIQFLKKNNNFVFDFFIFEVKEYHGKSEHLMRL